MLDVIFRRAACKVAVCKGEDMIKAKLQTSWKCDYDDVVSVMLIHCYS